MASENMTIKSLPPPNYGVERQAPPANGTETEKSVKESSPPQPVPREGIESIVSRIQEQVQNVRRNLAFEVDDTTGDVVVRVMDTEKKEMIRQIPPEELLEISRFLSRMSAEEATGLIIRTEA